MRILTGVLVGVIGLVGARGARELASRPAEEVDEPYAPSPDAAPIVALGYREVSADLLSIRLSGYFGSLQTTANGLASLVEAIVALDPSCQRVYEYGARAMTLATHGVDQSTYHRAIGVLERGIDEFPDDWKLPYLAGEIYTQDLETTNPVQRRAWDERGTSLTESAIRKPGAPAGSATWVASMRTKLGQRARAVEGLRELLLVTRDIDARKKLIDRLSTLVNTDSLELAAEIFEERHHFEAAWQRDRPMISPTMYVLLGPPLAPSFDMVDLATGGADLVGSQPVVEKLEPLD